MSGRRPGTMPEDLAALALAGAPALAPDGTWAVCSVQRTAPDRTRHHAHLLRYPTGPGAPRVLTDEGAWSDTAPAVSPDGSLTVFRSDRDGAPGLWLVPSAGGTPEPVAGAPEGRPVVFAWLDAERVAAVYARPDGTRAPAPVVIDWLRYKADGAGGPVEPLDTLWLLTVGRDGRPADAARLVEGGPARRLGTPVPDGAGGVFYTVRPRHADTAEPGGEVRRHTPATGADESVWRAPAPVRALAVTGSGRPVALAPGAAGHSVDPPRLWWADEGAPVFPGQDLECEYSVRADARPGGAARLLAADGERIVFAATVHGEAALYAGTSDGGPARRLTPPGRSVTDFATAAGTTVCCLESATEPVELYTVVPGGRRLSALNTAWARAARPVAPEEVSLTSPDGLPLRGLLYRSPTARRGDVLLRLHGGPHMTYGNAFDVETQSLLSAGFHVLLPEIRGGSGRGGAFRALSVGEWGRGDLADVLAFADHAVATGLADPDRLYLSGGSYGGYLANWTVTRTGRFRAAVSERSISNLLSKYGTSDNGFSVNRHEFGGADLFDAAGAAELWDRSPLAHAAAVTTPLLLVHGEVDQRCPVEQAEQFYAALRRRGHDVTLARYPGASHDFASAGRPDHRLHRLGLILDWLRAHAS
ncbi:S9 family peptidase [Streptomyces sp. NPDC050560]|uniref:S9 family peptidase n=1 Tax=Streptomyces sp. NPDC050560 TaxID=3365630 RepID=UPI0037B6213E